VFLDAAFGGELISAGSLAALTEPGVDGYGLGIEVLGLPSGRTLYGHRGEVVGYLSFAGIEPESGDSIMVLTSNPYLQASTLSDQIMPPGEQRESVRVLARRGGMRSAARRADPTDRIEKGVPNLSMNGRRTRTPAST
jgi:hypothetical protein